jgi:hypothetical protein
MMRIKLVLRQTISLQNLIGIKFFISDPNFCYTIKYIDENNKVTVYDHFARELIVVANKPESIHSKLNDTTWKYIGREEV